MSGGAADGPDPRRLERSVETRFGTLTVAASGGAVVSLRWGRAARQDADALLEDAAAQLAAYAAGERERFELPLRVDAGPFQRAVCAEIAAIPFGQTRTYGEIARTLGAGARAVGRACGANPIPLLIPCHRVMGARGLTGFSGAGGVETKVALLRHEGAAGLLI